MSIHSFFMVFWYYGILEIFATKVESCQKSRQNLEFFGPRKFFLGAFQKLYTCYHPCLAARRLEKFREDTPTSPEVIEAHTLNFKPNFNPPIASVFRITYVASRGVNYPPSSISGSMPARDEIPTVFVRKFFRHTNASRVWHFLSRNYKMADGNRK